MKAVIAPFALIDAGDASGTITSDILSTIQQDVFAYQAILVAGLVPPTGDLELQFSLDQVNWLQQSSQNTGSFVETDANSQATGTITFIGQPAVNATLTVNGTVVTFVSGAPIGNQVQIGATANNTSNNLQTFLAASVDPNIDDATYSTVAPTTTVTAVAAGSAGNSFTLATNSPNITLSGATLEGGVDRASTLVYEYGNVSAPYFRFVYTPSAGDGALTVLIAGKRLGD